MAIKQFVSELSGKRVEGELLKTLFFSLMGSLLIIGLGYLFSPMVKAALGSYGLYLFLAALGYAFLCSSVRQVKTYEGFACMSGMMIGMTVGMIAGFMSGYVVGATNGMFVGSIFGMTVGCVLGVWMGKCCGVMGVMEGLMAGFMGGLMGPMTAVMMLNDYLALASILVFIPCIAILASLQYMIYIETKERKREVSSSTARAVLLSTILMILTIIIIVFGPRSGLFG
jgi:hypothetical protein